MSQRQYFKDYLYDRNLKGSGKANSYLRSLDDLNLVIEKLIGCPNVYQITSLSIIRSLYKKTLQEQKNGSQSIFYGVITSESYWKNGFISAALNAYMAFLVDEKYIQTGLKSFHTNIPFEDLTSHIENILTIEEEDFIGKETIAKRKIRLNHIIFSRKIKDVYNNTCCITGLSFSQLNRSGHIIPWSVRSDIRLDPRNGIYLSATYDAAFDKYLISLDKDYKLIVSQQLREYYTKQIFQDYFQSYEGKKIQLPNKEFQPKKEYLDWHTSKLVS
jgi:putative restriction endonuclease